MLDNRAENERNKENKCCVYIFFILKESSLQNKRVQFLFNSIHPNIMHIGDVVNASKCASYI